MKKLLVAVSVIAFIALGISVVSALVQNSETARESSQISAMSHDLANSRQEVANLRAELRRDEMASKLSHDARERHHSRPTTDYRQSITMTRDPGALAASVLRNELRQRG